MKRGILILSLLAIHFVAFSVKKKPNKQVPLHGTYSIVSSRMNGKLIKLYLPESDLSFDSSSKSIAIFIGCNKMHAQFNIGLSKKLKFTKLVSSRMACQDNFEDGFKSTLLSVTDYSLKNDIMNLYKGKVLMMQLQQKKLNTQLQLTESIEGNYQLEQVFNGTKLVTGDFKKTSINISQNQINCNVGCNRIGGEFAIKGNHILPLKLAMTEMYCADVDALERQFVNALNSVDTYKLNDHTLSLFAQSKLVLVLQRKDE